MQSASLLCLYCLQTLHQNTQVLSSRALADQRSSNPTCVTLPCGVGPTVWPSTTWGIMGRPGTDVCLGRLGCTGQPQGLSCCFPFSFSLLWALVSFLLPPLKISVYEHSPRKEGGTQRHLPAPLSPPSPCSPRCGGPLHGTRWNPSSLSSSSLGPGAGGWTA